MTIFAKDRSLIEQGKHRDIGCRLMLNICFDELMLSVFVVFRC